MKKEIRVIIPGLQGHGYSIITKGEYSITDMVIDIMEIKDQTHIREALTIPAMVIAGFDDRRVREFTKTWYFRGD